jgi:hypothetical protein
LHGLEDVALLEEDGPVAKLASNWVLALDPLVCAAIGALVNEGLQHLLTLEQQEIVLA